MASCPVGVVFSLITTLRLCNVTHHLYLNTPLVNSTMKPYTADAFALVFFLNDVACVLFMQWVKLFFAR